MLDLRNRSTSRKTRLWLATAALAMVMGVGALNTAPAEAREAPGFDRGQNVSVQDRARPDYEPVGVQWGAVALRPRLGVSVAVEDNVFFTQTNERDDVVTTLNAEVQASTTWSRNAARLTVGLTDKRYTDFDSENRTDEYVNGEVRLDVFGESAIAIGGSHANLGEARFSPDTPGTAAKPGDYDVTEGYVLGTATFARTRLSARVSQRSFSYKPVALIGGGFEDAPDRDRDETALTLKAEYAVSPRTAAFVEAAIENRDYKRRPPQTAVNRDNDVTRVLVGVNFDIASLARGEIAIGQLDQSFDQAGLSGASGLAVSAKAEWFPQALTTVTVNAARRVEETNIGPAASFTLTEAGARIDHELLQNVILSAQASAGQRDFEGLARKDDLAFAGVSARYLVNRTVELGAGWFLDRQESKGAARDRDYDANRIVLSVTLRR
jgi:hypothetical protein